MASLKESMQRPVRVFKMPYNISCVAFQGEMDSYQSLALGLVDGAIIIIDLILGVEKMFLEKHPAEISALAFWEDKTLISGSIDGRVNVSELEVEADSQSAPRKVLRCQNCQDRRIPVAKAIASEFGIGAAVDIEGNCRLYDLVRQRKIAKVSSLNQRELDARFAVNNCKWRLLPQVTFEVTAESLLAVTQTLDVPHSNSEETVASEKYLFSDRRFCDIKENLKSLSQIALEHPEVPFYHQRSTLCIFRFEDVIFSLFPHFAQIRKRGMPSVKENFIKTDPLSKDIGREPAQQSNNQFASNNFMSIHSGGDKQKGDLSSSKSGHDDLSTLSKRDR